VVFDVTWRLAQDEKNPVTGPTLKDCLVIATAFFLTGCSVERVAETTSPESQETILQQVADQDCTHLDPELQGSCEQMRARAAEALKARRDDSGK
jgi:hypothetical protein